MTGEEHTLQDNLTRKQTLSLGVQLYSDISSCFDLVYL